MQMDICGFYGQCLAEGNGEEERKIKRILDIKGLGRTLDKLCHCISPSCSVCLFVCLFIYFPEGMSSTSGHSDLSKSPSLLLVC